MDAVIRHNKSHDASAKLGGKVVIALNDETLTLHTTV
jgi:hypothetical protein